MLAFLSSTNEALNGPTAEGMKFQNECTLFCFYAVITPCACAQQG